MTYTKHLGLLLALIPCDFAYSFALRPGDIIAASQRDLTDPLVRGGSVFHIDPISGNRTVLSGPLLGSGPLFVGPEAAAIEPSGTILVGDVLLDSVIRIDPVTGDRTTVSGVDPVSGLLVGNGPLMQGPHAMTVDRDGSILVADGVPLPAVFRIDPSTGDRTIISARLANTSFMIGEGPGFPNLTGIAVERTGDILVTTRGCCPQPAIYRVDPANGNRSIVRSGRFDSLVGIHGNRKFDASCHLGSVRRHSGPADDGQNEPASDEEAIESPEDAALRRTPTRSFRKKPVTFLGNSLQ